LVKRVRSLVRKNRWRSRVERNQNEHPHPKAKPKPIRFNCGYCGRDGHKNEFLMRTSPPAIHLRLHKIELLLVLLLVPVLVNLINK
jgi:hypothetical protein